MNNIDLTKKEEKLLTRMAKMRKLYLGISILCVFIALSLLVYHLLIAKDFNGTRFVIVILVLLAGKTNLRQYRVAGIFNKFRQSAN